MVEVLVSELDDTRLVDVARGGDQPAFAELYQRYFDPVYDFVARMTRNRDEAADIAQDTFLKAMNALAGLKEGASFKSWVFTIARNTALNRMERASRTRPLAFNDVEGEEVSFQLIDEDRLGNPQEAAEAREVAALVWEAAAGLDPKQLSLLDLHLRQGLDSAEIADVLGVTKNNGYVMLNRLKKAVEEAIGAFVMLHHGRRYCDELNAALAEARAEVASPEARRLVSRHVAACPGCEERRKRMVAPLAVFGAFVPVASPPGLKAEVLGKLLAGWPAVVPHAVHTAEFPPNPVVPPAGPLGRVLAALAGFGGAALILGGALLWPESPIALTGGDRDPIVIPVAGPTDSPTPTPQAQATPEPSPTPEPAAGGETPTAEDARTPTLTPSPAATVTSTRTPAGTPTPGPGGVGTATRTPSPSPTPSPFPTPPKTPTPTPAVCNPSISSSTGGSLNMGELSSLTFYVFNGSFCGSVEVTITVATGAPWLSVSPASATIAAGKDLAVLLTADRKQLQPGQSFGTVSVSVPGTSTALSITVSIDGPTPTPAPTPAPTPGDTEPPVVSAASASCPPRTQAIEVSASASDPSGVAAVVLDNGIAQQQLSLAGGSAESGRWTGTFIFNRSASYWQLIAYDTLGNYSFAPLTPVGCS